MSSRFSVDAVFRAVDKISAPISKMQARASKFTRGLRRGFHKVNKAVDSVNGRLARTGAIAGGALAAGAGIAVVALNKVADAADNLAKTSRRIDFPIEELQEWSFVASQSGVDTKTFGSSLGAFTKRLGEARAGSGALVTFLKRTDAALLDQVTSAGSSAEAFELVINKMRETTNASDRAALASAAFSRAGMKLANISDNSADAVARLRKEQRQNGVITMQQAKIMETYNDSVDSLQRSIFGLQANAVAPLAPELTKLATATRGWIIENRKLVSLRLAEGIQFITDNADSLGQVALGLVKVLAGWLAMTIVLKVATAAFNVVMIASKVIAFGWAIAGKALVLVGTLAVGMFKAIRVAVLLFNIALALNPIGVIVGLIAVLIAAGVALALNWESVVGAMSGVWAAIKTLVLVGTLAVGMFKAAGIAVLLFNAVLALNPIALVVGLIALLIAAGVALALNWESVVGALSGAWASIKSVVSSGVDFVLGLLSTMAAPFAMIVEGISAIVDAAGGLFGGTSTIQLVAPKLPGAQGDSETDTPSTPPPQVVSAAEQTARSIEERRTTSTAELMIRDQTGRAELSQDKGPGFGIRLEQSGAV
jgi:hypothetical protein